MPSFGATAAQDKANAATQTQRTTFARFPAGVPCVVVLPSRGVGKHQSQDRYLNRKGGFTAQRRLAHRFAGKTHAVGPAHEAWGRVIGVLLLEPADLVAGSAHYQARGGLGLAEPTFLDRSPESCREFFDGSNLGLDGEVQEGKVPLQGEQAIVGVLEVQDRPVQVVDGRHDESELRFKSHGRNGVGQGCTKMVPPPAVTAAGAGLPPASGSSQGRGARKEVPSTAAPAGLVPTAVAPTGTPSGVLPAVAGQDLKGVQEGSGLYGTAWKGRGRLTSSLPVRSRSRQATPAELARLTAELHA